MSRARLERIAQPKLFAPLLALLAVAVCYWLADRGLPNPDEGAYLTAAAKILRGGVFYRDIDAYPLPGASYLLAGAMSIFGEHLSVARGLAGAGFVAMVLGVYAAALRLMRPERAALCGLSLLALKFWAFPNFTAYLYSDLAIALTVVALALFLYRRPGGGLARLFWMGVLVGLAVLAKQSTGLYVGTALAVLLVWPGLRSDRPRHELAALAAGAAAVAVPVAVYFAWHGVLAQMLFSGFIRPFTGYLPTSGVSALPPLAWWQLGKLRGGAGMPYLPLLVTEMIRRGLLPGPSGPWWLATELFSRVLYAAVPLAFGLCGLRWLRGRLDPPRFASACVCLAIALSVFPRADYPHVIDVYPAVLLVLFSLGRREGGRPRLQAAGVTLVLALTLALTLRYDGYLSHRLSLERADLWVRASDAWVANLVELVQREVPPGTPLFVYGHEAYYYFLTDRYFPWPFSQLYPGMTGGPGGRPLAALLRRTRPPLVVQGIVRWPGMPSLAGSAGAVRATLDRLYRDDTASVAPARELPPRWAFGLLRLRPTAAD